MLNGMEKPPASGKLSGMKNGGSFMGFIGAGPVDAYFIDSFPGNTPVGRCDRCNFLEDGFTVFIGHLITHSFGDFTKDFPVRPGFSRSFHCFSDPLNPSFRVTECPVFFSKAESRQNNICYLCGFGLEDILNNKKIQVCKGLSYMVEVWIRNQGIFANNKE